jgi:hypothetical protein
MEAASEPRMTPDDPTAELLAAALGTGASYQRAAAIAGCSKATVKRRMADPAFRSRVAELRRDQVRRVELRLGELTTDALDALEALLAYSEAPGPRLSAAKTVLEGFLRFRDSGEVEHRLAELEARMAPRAERNGHAGALP